MRRKPVISLRGPVPRLHSPAASASSPLPLPPAQPQSISLLTQYPSDQAAAGKNGHSALLRHIVDLEEHEDDDCALSGSGGGCSQAPLDLSLKDGPARQFSPSLSAPTTATAQQQQQLSLSSPKPSQPAPGTTRLSCTACDREFFDRSTLNRHIRTVHSGCKPHRCELCGKGFARADYLRKHYTTHAGSGGHAVAAASAGSAATLPSPPQLAIQSPQLPLQQKPPPPPPPLSPEVANVLKAIWLQHKLLTGPSAHQL